MSFLRKHQPDIFSTRTTSRDTVNSLSPEDVDAAPVLDPSKISEVQARGAYVIDIRGHFAFSIGHIPGSINILDDYFASTIESGQVFPDGKPILIVCRIGDISKKFAAYLAKQGYEAYSLEGGYQAYKQGGFDVEKSRKEEKIAA